jgi:hypothetical protein
MAEGRVSDGGIPDRAPDGQEFLLAEADDFEKEAEALGKSVDFQRFLDERSRSPRRIALEEIEAETDEELARQRKTAG